MKKKYFQIVGIFVFLFILGSNFHILYPIIYYNRSESTLDETEPGLLQINWNRDSTNITPMWAKKINAKGKTLYQENKIESVRKELNIGASNFLKSYSSFLLFMNQIELLEIEQIDKFEMSKNLDMSLNYIENTISSYEQLLGIYGNIKKNEFIQKKLKNYDYDSFFKSKKFRIDVINTIKEFLSKGDMQGLYEKAQEHHKSIKSKLIFFRDKFNFKNLDTIAETIWELNTLYTETLEMGQLTAQIMIDITESKNVLNASTSTNYNFSLNNTIKIELNR